MRMLFLFLAASICHVSTSRELMIQHACKIVPTLSFCRSHDKTSDLEKAADEKTDVFLRWAFVAAKDTKDIEDPDIEDTEELESSHKQPENIEQYCSKYKTNFNNYCHSGEKLEKLEGLLAHFCGSYKKNCNPDTGKEEIFPTPKPLFPSEKFNSHSEQKPEVTTTTTAPVTSTYCEDFVKVYIADCKREGFTNNDFCGFYRKRCGDVDGETATQTTDSAKEKEVDSLEEIDSKELEDLSAEASDKGKPEGGGANKNDEVTQYCTSYVENYNFFCVGEKKPEHEKFCSSYATNCPNSASWV